MGCDGGTIPRRDELVRLKKKPEVKDKDSERLYRWRHCSLTQQKLQQPIVMCGLGRLYSKSNIIEQLLEKTPMPESCSHIKGLKDIKDLKLTANPSYSPEDDKNAPFICALIGLEMSGQFRFVALWTCGCVFSERALKQLKSNICNICQTPYSEQDVVILNGNEEDVDMMRTRMEARNARMKAAKKDKKLKVKTEIPESSTSTFVKPSTSKEPEEIKKEPKPSSSKLPMVANPSVIAARKREIITDMIGSDPNCKKAKKDYSVKNDPKATEVYKSIFTSHESEQTQNRAHWITYNPFYN
ncbi:CLUMA_CG005483, isoform A [Clunio marinus]|uniref:Replication termination factor 2 n=1 Tax=Clunio marinus TaxID=568069 RepID=A0A1J1HZ88_9DIPT|nr:CLUMA_CG005483, isoform A [Clunio marinus]